ncbi:carbohydrate binding domain-containing protein, partial [Flavobacterium sp. A45]|uniref:carbohydrate binding domain-containing protein n=1 Tax=Flavobacterium sp. A45 TaxID=1945862 RepID=UPI0009C70CF6
MKTKLLVLLFLASLTTYAQTNLVPNGGFETWTNSTTLSNWTTANNVIQNTSSYTEGSKSVQLSITSTALSPKITAQVPMTAGTTYTVKFKYKYVNSNYSGQHPISLNISQNGSATTLSSSTFATDNNWTIKETTFTPDQNMSYDLDISLYTFDSEAFDVLIDDVQVYIQGTEQYTLIPDVNFENKLIALGIDSGVADGKVMTNSVNKLTSLNVSNSSIADLTGIEDFVALKTLDCQSNKLNSLNVTKNLDLINLNCSANYLTSINVTKNSALKSLNVSYMAEGVSSSLSGQGKIESLDLSKNLALTDLNCSYNKLTSLDVSNNVLLINLICNATFLTKIDVSKNIALKSLSIA